MINIARPTSPSPALIEDRGDNGRLGEGIRRGCMGWEMLFVCTMQALKNPEVGTTDVCCK